LSEHQDDYIRNNGLEDFYQTVKAQSFSTLPGLSVLDL